MLTRDEDIILDVMDGLEYWEEVQRATGCDDERSKEIFARYSEIREKYIRLYGKNCDE